MDNLVDRVDANALMGIGPSALSSDNALRQVLWIDAATPELSRVKILGLVVYNYGALIVRKLQVGCRRCTFSTWWAGAILSRNGVGIPERSVISVIVPNTYVLSGLKNMHRIFIHTGSPWASTSDESSNTRE